MRLRFETPVKPTAPNIELTAPKTTAAKLFLSPAFGSLDWLVFLTGFFETSGVGVSGVVKVVLSYEWG